MKEKICISVGELATTMAETGSVGVSQMQESEAGDAMDESMDDAICDSGPETQRACAVAILHKRIQTRLV
jgi:hypothetical protein